MRVCHIATALSLSCCSFCKDGCTAVALDAGTVKLETLEMLVATSEDIASETAGHASPYPGFLLAKDRLHGGMTFDSIENLAAADALLEPVLAPVAPVEPRGRAARRKPGSAD